VNKNIEIDDLLDRLFTKLRKIEKQQRSKGVGPKQSVAQALQF
jgi:hypothetical protein